MTVDLLHFHPLVLGGVLVVGILLLGLLGRVVLGVL